MSASCRILPAVALASALVTLAPPSPAAAQDASDFFVRLNALEGQVRTLSGQVEELQHENQQLRDQLRRFQEDVDFRFQERGGKAAQPGAASGPQAVPGPAQPRPQRRSDVFDPAADPNAPGAPRPLGTTAPSGALPGAGVAGGDPSGPLDLSQMSAAAAAGDAMPAMPPGPRATSVAATGAGDPRQDYDLAVGYLRQRQYEQAEMAFRQFLQSYPRDRMVPDATFLLGESYLSRGRYREAAEQYLKVTTDYAKSRRAPEGFVKLAVALNGMGAHDQACATLGEVERKYPDAAANVKQAVTRERQRAKC